MGSLRSMLRAGESEMGGGDDGARNGSRDAAPCTEQGVLGVLVLFAAAQADADKSGGLTIEEFKSVFDSLRKRPPVRQPASASLRRPCG